MRNIFQIGAAAGLSLLQTVFVPINFALIVVLLIVSGGNVGRALVLLLGSSFFLSIFGNLNFGLTLVSFASSVLVFLLLKRTLPDRNIIKFALFSITLIFWEMFIRTTSTIYSNFA